MVRGRNRPLVRINKTVHKFPTGTSSLSHLLGCVDVLTALVLPLVTTNTSTRGVLHLGEGVRLELKSGGSGRRVREAEWGLREEVGE